MPESVERSRERSAWECRDIGVEKDVETEVSESVERYIYGEVPGEKEVPDTVETDVDSSGTSKIIEPLTFVS